MYKNNNYNKCIICGKFSPRITREHHPTDSLIKNKIYNQYLIFPTCQKCNNMYSKNEEFLVHLINIYRHKFCGEQLNAKTDRALKRNGKMNEEINRFFECGKIRNEIKKAYLFSLFEKYAKIHLYINNDHYKDNVDIRIKKLFFDNEVSKEQIKDFFAPQEIELLLEEQQIDYFDTLIDGSMSQNILSSNFIVNKSGVFATFNNLYPREYAFMMYYKGLNTKQTNLKIVVKDCLMCHILITEKE